MENMSEFMVMFRRRVCEEDHRPPVETAAQWCHDRSPILTTKQLTRVPPLVHSLLRRCWARAPSARPSFQELISDIDALMLAATIDDDAGRR